MTNVHPIVRWIVFIPASLLAGWASYYIIILVQKIKPFGGLAEYFIQISAAGLSGVAAIYVAVYIAPRFKKRVILGYVIATFLFMLLTLFTTPILEDSVMEILRYVAQNVGIIGGGWYLYQQEYDSSMIMG